MNLMNISLNIRNKMKKYCVFYDPIYVKVLKDKIKLYDSAVSP